MSEWKRVDQELPPNDDDVLVRVRGESHTGYLYRARMVWVVPSWADNGDALVGNHVTHWMPLPAAPTEEKK